MDVNDPNKIRSHYFNEHRNQSVFIGLNKTVINYVGKID